jgi:hypothetical protein
MKRDSIHCKKHAKVGNIRGSTNEPDGNSEIKNVDPSAKFKEHFSFLGKPVIPNLSGEYVAFEDSSNGRYHIKLWHVRSGAVFEIPAGLAFDAPISSNPNVPNTSVNPEGKG